MSKKDIINIKGVIQFLIDTKQLFAIRESQIKNK